MKLYVVLIAISLWYIDVNAQDRIFNYTYQSGVLAKGEKEIEIWATYRAGRENFYRRTDARAEVEIGLSKKLQTAFYLNYTSKATGFMADSLSAIEHDNEFSFSNEWKLKLSDPSASMIGSALYGEITIGTTEFEIEGKVILDKQIGRVTQAINLAFEPEWEWEAGIGEIAAHIEYKFEFNYGIGVDLGKGWVMGAELRNPNVYVDGYWAHSAIYAGPCVSYAGSGFWVNFTLMPQVAGLRGITSG
ncbi:MAG: hypothetical protein NT040_02765 [Bacteroidetes bacterium]|nr:hypothetical protein [Bacteroidota bacterium]